MKINGDWAKASLMTLKEGFVDYGSANDLYKEVLDYILQLEEDKTLLEREVAYLDERY